MNKIIDFTNYKLSSRNLQYAGRAGEKRGIIYNNENWFLKFPKNTLGMNNVDGISYVTSPLSEYIGCNIYKILGYDVQDTILGIFFDGKRYKVVCACKDFIKDDTNEILIPYTALRNDTNPLIIERRDSSIDSASNINEIIFQLRHNTILSKIQNSQQYFWRMILIDLLINNNDRNEDNWGVIKYKKENKYVMSPIYDCGNCFYSKSSDKKIKSILKDNDRLLSSSLNGVTAYDDENGKRISLMNIINYIDENNLNIIKEIYTNVINNLDKIKNVFENIPNEYKCVDIITDERKLYYYETFKIRLEYLKNYID